MMAPVIPRELSAISADWLSSVLDVDISSVAVADAHEGTTGRGVLSLDAAPDAGLPSSLFIKLPPGDETQRAFVVSSGMGRREALFYQQLAGEVPVRVPRCYHADTDDPGEHYIMLLEPLLESGCTFRNASTRYSLEYLEAMMAQFALLHAAYWDTPRFDTDLAWLEPPRQHPIGASLVEKALSTHGAAQPPVFRELAELYLSQTDAVHALWNRGVPTLVHGDAHDGNLFMDGDTPGFLDWALVARAPAMRDVGYFLAATLRPEDRGHLLPLVDSYRDGLLAAGVTPPSQRDLQEQFRWHAVYVWVGTVVTLAMGDAWQPADYIQATLARLQDTLAAEGCAGALRAGL
jgi:hypothetical protein